MERVYVVSAPTPLELPPQKRFKLYNCDCIVLYIVFAIYLLTDDVRR